MTTEQIEQERRAFEVAFSLLPDVEMPLSWPVMKVHAFQGWLARAAMPVTVTDAQIQERDNAMAEDLLPHREERTAYIAIGRIEALEAQLAEAKQHVRTIIADFAGEHGSTIINVGGSKCSHCDVLIAAQAWLDGMEG